MDALDSHHANPIEDRETGVSAGRVEWTQGGWSGRRESVVGTEYTCMKVYTYKCSPVYTNITANTHTHLTCHMGKF